MVLCTCVFFRVCVFVYVCCFGYVACRVVKMGDDVFCVGPRAYVLLPVPVLVPVSVPGVMVTVPGKGGEEGRGLGLGACE